MTGFILEIGFQRKGRNYEIQENEKWIGERFLEEMDAAEYEYHETLVMKDLAEGITRAEEQKGEKKNDII